MGSTRRRALPCLRSRGMSLVAPRPCSCSLSLKSCNALCDFFFLLLFFLFIIYFTPPEWLSSLVMNYQRIHHPLESCPESPLHFHKRSFQTHSTTSRYGTQPQTRRVPTKVAIGKRGPLPPSGYGSNSATLPQELVLHEPATVSPTLETLHPSETSILWPNDQRQRSTLHV